MADSSRPSNTLRVERWAFSDWGSTHNPSSLGMNALLDVAFSIFINAGCTELLNISSGKLRIFLCKIRDNYRSNAYHCWAHAVHVLMNAARLLRGLKEPTLFPPTDRFCLLFAALVHDLDHPGHTNSMEISIQSDVARTYNDQSVLEMHSISLAYDISDQIQLFEQLDDCTRDGIRENIVEITLATDIGPPSGRRRSAFALSKWESAFANGFSVENRTQRICILAWLMRAADVGSAMQPYPIFATWSQRLNMENNVASGLTRLNHALTQGPFLAKYCLPLIRFLQTQPLLTIGDKMCSLLEANLERWLGLTCDERCMDLSQHQNACLHAQCHPEYVPQKLCL